MKRRRTATLLFVFLATVLMFFAVNRVFFFSPTILETASSYLLYPILWIQRGMVNTLHRWQMHSATVAELHREIAHLMVQRDELYAQNVELQASMMHMHDIQELIDYKSRYEAKKMVLAQILVRHIADDGHYILINAGSKKGIVVDMPVVYKNVLLGRVVEVWPLYSKVILTTDRTCKVAARCVKSGARGIHEGGNRCDATYLKHVSHLHQLQKGDPVLSSGQGLVFPQGFALGTITDFERDGIEYHITIQPILDIHRLEYCFVLFY